MSRAVQATALGNAVRNGCPYVHRSGRKVVVVFRAQLDAVARTVSGNCIDKTFASAGMARAVESRVFSDLRAFPEHAGRILDVGELYATAALRHARRRRGKL
jgi:hypothetical protein